MLERSITEAIKAEFGRQAADSPSGLSVDTSNGVRVHGLVDLYALATAVTLSVADGP